MIFKFFHKNRHILLAFLGLVVLLTLENRTGVSKWTLLVPVLLAMLAIMSAFDRVFLRQEINNG